MYLRQSTSSQEILIGPFLDDADGKTAKTALSIANTDLKVWKHGATSEASKNSGGATHIASGRYYAVLDATDTDTVGLLEVNCHVSGALPCKVRLQVLEEAVYDALFAASAVGYVADQPVNATKFGGTTVTGRDIGASVLLSSGTGTGQLKLASGYVAMTWADIAAPTTAVALTGTTIATTQKVDVETIKTQSVTCAAGVTVGAYVGGTGAAALEATAQSILTDTGTTLQGDITAILADTNELQTDWANGGRLDLIVDDILADTAVIGAAGAGLTAVPWNAAWDAEVQSEVEDAIVVHRLDELLNADSDIDGAAPPTVGSVFHELMTKAAGSFTYDQTTDSLEALRDRGDAAWITATGFSTHSASDVWAVATRVLTAATNISGPIADQVWEEAIADHSGTAGSTAAALNSAGSAGDPWGTALPGAYSAGTAGYIVGNQLDAAVSSRSTLTAGSVWGYTFVIPVADSALDYLVRIEDAIDTEVAAIKAKTDNLPAAPAATGDCITAAGVRTAVGLASANLDTQLGDLPTNAELATALGTADDATLAAIAALNNLSAAQVTAAVPTAAQTAAAVLAAGDVDGYSLEETLKICLAALAGKLSGAATATVTIRAADDSKARITATCDSSGNRSAITLDETG